MQVKEKLVAGDGIMINFLSVMQELCYKVKLEKIDPFYIFHESTLCDVSNESRLCMTKQEATDWQMDLSKSVFKEVNFHSQCWYMTLFAHHVGILPVMRKYTRRMRAIRDLQRMVDEMEKTEQWGGLPVGSRHKRLLKKWKSQLKKLNKSKICSDAGLLDEKLLERCLTFYSGVCLMLLGCLLGNNDNPQTSSIEVARMMCSPGADPPKLPSTTPKLFAAMPEWFLDDITEFLLFTTQHQRKVPLNNMNDSFISLIIMVLCCPQHISNPYLTAKFAEVLFMLTPAVQPQAEMLHRQISHHQLCHLLPVSLMRFYTLVESTGTSSEFYDKFTIR